MVLSFWIMPVDPDPKAYTPRTSREASDERKETCLGRSLFGYARI